MNPFNTAIRPVGFPEYRPDGDIVHEDRFSDNLHDWYLLRNPDGMHELRVIFCSGDLAGVIYNIDSHYTGVGIRRAVAWMIDCQG